VVPENIHTPTTEGIGNSGGVGGSKAQENPEERGVKRINYFPEGQLRFIPMYKLQIKFENYYLPNL